MVMNPLMKNILKKLNDPDLPEKISGLSQSELNTLLLEINKRYTSRLSAADLMKKYRSNRFVKPGGIDPVRFHSLEAELLSDAEKHGFQSVLLSPVAPLGSCSVFACVDQNNIISASRGTEVLSDPTNMLAIMIADELKWGHINNKEPVHYCSTHRVARGQAFSGRISFPHFGIFCIVSSGKDSGSYNCEKALLTEQLNFYRNFFDTKYHADFSVVMRMRGGYTDDVGFFERITEHVKKELPGVPVSIDTHDVNNAYYKGINFKIYMHTDSEPIEIGDGGFVDWMQKLTGSRKERCLISGLGMDRLMLVSR